MSKQIQTQAAKLWQTISAPETLNAYTSVVFATWKILRELAILLWLAICFILVAADWLLSAAFQLGKATRNWFNQVGKSEQVGTEAGKLLLSASRSSAYAAVSQARLQLGLPEKPRPVLQLPNEAQPVMESVVAQEIAAPAKLSSKAMTMEDETETTS